VQSIAAFTRAYMFDEHVRGCVCPSKGYVDEYVRAFKHVETFGVFDEHVCPCKCYVEHVRGSRGSRVNQARGHAYSTIKINKHARLDHRNQIMTGADRTPANNAKQ
jgi:hypothetical protein